MKLLSSIFVATTYSRVKCFKSKEMKDVLMKFEKNETIWVKLNMCLDSSMTRFIAVVWPIQGYIKAVRLHFNPDVKLFFHAPGSKWKKLCKKWFGKGKNRIYFTQVLVHATARYAFLTWKFEEDYLDFLWKNLDATFDSEMLVEEIFAFLNHGSQKFVLHIDPYIYHDSAGGKQRFIDILVEDENGIELIEKGFSSHVCKGCHWNFANTKYEWLSGKESGKVPAVVLKACRFLVDDMYPGFLINAPITCYEKRAQANLQMFAEKSLAMLNYIK